MATIYGYYYSNFGHIHHLEVKEKMKRTWSVMLVTTVLLFSACSNVTSSGQSPSPEIPNEVPNDSRLPGETGEECQRRIGDLEGCFGLEEMQTYADKGIGFVTEFISETYANPVLMTPKNWYFVNQGDSGSMPCQEQKPDGTIGPGTYNDEIYAYCPVDNNVYIGQISIWAYYYTTGDAGPIVALAHEAGHHFQTVAGINATVDTQAEAITQENQADCIAGAFTLWLNTKGYLKQADDIGDIDVLLPMIADAESNINRVHGTLQERANAFIAGYQGGMASCNSFFPTIPIISSS